MFWDRAHTINQFFIRLTTHHWKCQLAKKKELLIPPIWGCCGPTGGSIFTPGQKNHPAFFEGRWYTGKMARQIWAEWAVCLSSYLWKGWMVFLPRGKNWTSSRSTTTPDRWYWKFFFFGQLVLPMMCVKPFKFFFKTIIIYSLKQLEGNSYIRYLYWFQTPNAAPVFLIYRVILQLKKVKKH